MNKRSQFAAAFFLFAPPASAMQAAASAVAPAAQCAFVPGCRLGRRYARFFRPIACGNTGFFTPYCLRQYGLFSPYCLRQYGLFIALLPAEIRALAPAVAAAAAMRLRIFDAVPLAGLPIARNMADFIGRSGSIGSPLYV